MMNSTQRHFGPGLDAQNVLRKVNFSNSKKAQGNRFGSVQRDRTGDTQPFTADLKKESYSPHNFTHEPINENDEELEELPDSRLQILDLDGDERKDIVDQYF